MAEETTDTKTWSDQARELGDRIVNLTLMQAKELGDYLKEEHGIEPAAGAVAVAAPPGTGGEEQAAQEEKTIFDVVLKATGDKKIQVIKVVRAATNLGLKEAKDLVESAPTAIKEGISKEDAEELKKKIEEAGGVVELA